MVVLCFIAVLLLFVLSYILMDQDFFCPALLILESFILVLFFASLYYTKWEQSYSVNFCVVVVFGLLFFILASLGVKLLFEGKRLKILPLSGVRQRYSRNRAQTLLLIFDVIIIVIYSIEVYRLSVAYGNYNGLSGMFYVYHNSVLLNNDGTGPQMRKWIVLLFRLSSVFAYYFLYVFLNNVIRQKEKIKNNLFFLSFTVLYWIGVFISSQRTSIIYQLFAAIFIGYIMMRQIDNVRSRTLKKIIKIICISLILAAALLYILGSLMGRISEVNFIDYFAVYCAGSIPNLSKLVSDQGVSFFSGTASPIASQFYTYSGARANLYTLFGELLATDGWLKTWIYMIFISLGYSVVYYLGIYKTKPSFNSDYILIIYAYATEGLLMAGLCDVVSKNIVTQGYILVAAGILVMHILCNNKINFRRN